MGENPCREGGGGIAGRLGSVLGAGARELFSEDGGGGFVAVHLGEAEAEGEDPLVVELIFRKFEQKQGGLFRVGEVEGTFDGGEGEVGIWGVGFVAVDGAAGGGGKFARSGGVIDLFEENELIAIAEAADVVEPEDEDEAEEEEGDVEEEGGPHDAGDHAEDFADEAGEVGAAPDEDDEEGRQKDEAEADPEGLSLICVESHSGGGGDGRTIPKICGACNRASRGTCSGWSCGIQENVSGVSLVVSAGTGRRAPI